MKFSIDRIENGIAVCYDGESKRYEFSAESLGLPVGSLFEAELDDKGQPAMVVSLEEETAQTRKSGKQRLTALFRRKPKK